MGDLLDHVYVLHVKKGYEDRKEHIDTHLPSRGIKKFRYILDGDIEDLTDEILEKHFKSGLTKAQMSCFYKHFLVYQDMVDKSINTALVFEDDAILTTNAVDDLYLAFEEVRQDENYLINIEINLRCVPSKIKKTNKKLYLAKHTKLAGGYIIHLDVAKKIVNYLNEHKTNLPIDGFQSEIRDTLKYNIYWMDPPVVSQGSKNGKFDSELSNRKKSKYAYIGANIRNYYQKNVVSNLSKKRMNTFLNVTYYEN